jgi:phosphatidyl-myo-inositol dimannoside synthase
VTSPRVLLLCRTFPPMVGGIERYVSDLFEQAPVEAEIVAPAYEGDAAIDARSRHAVRRYPFPAVLREGKRPLLPLAPVALAAALGRRPTLVCSDQIQTAAVGLPLARALGVPHVVFAYGMELSPLRMRRFKQWALDGSSAVVSISRFTSGRLRELYGVTDDRITLVHPGVDVRRFQPAADGERAQERGPVLLTVGRLDASQPYKGYDRAIRALAAIGDEFPTAQLLVAGRGDDQPRLEALAASLGVASRVRFLGFVPDADLPDLYRRADVFVLPSGSPDAAALNVEGYGIVFAEAAACGTPSIAYRLGGVTDAVIDGATGFLTAPEEPAFQSALRTLLRDRALRARFGAAARSHAERALAWQANVDNFTGLIGALHRAREHEPLRA